jgi:hypothetical protein
MAKKKQLVCLPDAQWILKEIVDVVHVTHLSKGLSGRTNFGLGDTKLRRILKDGKFGPGDLRRILARLKSLGGEEQTAVATLIVKFEAIVTRQADEPLEQALAKVAPKTDQEHERELNRIASNIARLHPSTMKDITFLKSVRFTLGVIYALKMAIKCGFQDAGMREYDLTRVAAALGSANEAPERPWLAGYYLNDALVRLTSLKKRLGVRPELRELFGSPAFEEVLRECDTLLSGGFVERERQVGLAKLVAVLCEIDTRLPDLVRHGTQKTHG